MLLRIHDTITAVASPPGGGLRGIVRVSGPLAVTTASSWFRGKGSLQLADIRRPTAVIGEAILNDRGAWLPGELYLWPGERSYTRQPTVEFHTLGSPPLLNLLVQKVCAHGARAAEPGEFTLRAFLAGRLDLTQAEAVLGVIDANSRTELDVALRQLGGGLAVPLSRLRNELLDALAHLEAGLDFAEEDIEFIARDALRRQLVAARDEVADLAARMSARSSAASEYRVVLYGRPNAGKSSLLNALAQSQQALVSAVAGTTRDYVTATIDCGGIRCRFVDTAGRTDAAGDEIAGDEIGAAAEGAAAQQAQGAHLRLLCVDATRSPDDWEHAEAGRVDPQRLVVHTKCDAVLESAAYCDVSTSSISGQGLGELKQAVADRLMQLIGVQGDVVAGTSARCRDSLDRALASLAAALDAVDRNVGEELVAGEIRLALEELGRIAGAVYTDDILDRIFSRFCIGK